MALSGSLWLPLALSGSLWLSIALQICLPSPCSAHKALAQLGTPFLRSLTLISPAQVRCTSTNCTVTHLGNNWIFTQPFISLITVFDNHRSQVRIRLIYTGLTILLVYIVFCIFISFNFSIFSVPMAYINKISMINFQYCPWPGC